MDLRCHIGFSSENSLHQAILFSSFEEGRESEVGDLEDEILAEEKIFGLHISVGNSSLMDMAEPANHLEEIGPGYLLSESTSVGNKLEDLTSRNVFKNDGEALVCCSILLFVSGLFKNVDKVDDVGVVEFLHD